MDNFPPSLESLDIRGIARVLHKSVRTIHRYVKEIKEYPDALPPFFYSGKTILFPIVGVSKWISENSNCLIDIDTELFSKQAIIKTSTAHPIIRVHRCL